MVERVFGQHPGEEMNMDGSKEPLRIKTAFVTGAVDDFPHAADRQRMKGVHETIEEVCRKAGIDVLDPFLSERSYGNDAFGRDLIIIEATFFQPIVRHDLREALQSQKRVIMCHEVKAPAAHMYASLLKVRPHLMAYDRYTDLSQSLKEWLLANARVE